MPHSREGPHGAAVVMLREVGEDQDRLIHQKRAEKTMAYENAGKIR